MPDHPGCHDDDEQGKQFAEHQSREVGGNGPAQEPPADGCSSPSSRPPASSLPRGLWWANAPLIIVGIITARDVPKARRVARVLSIPPPEYSQYWTGVIRNPPPTPEEP